MKIVFSTFGSLGDIHPYLAIAARAKARGHEAIVATSLKYRTKTEALGLIFREVRPNLPNSEEFAEVARRVMNSKQGPENLFREILVPGLRHNYEDLLQAFADADLAITHPAALGGPLAARKLQIPWLSSVLSPISLWSRFDPPVPPTLPHLNWLRFLGPLWGTSTRLMAHRFTRDWLLEVDQLREAQGLPNCGHPLFAGSHSPHGTLALFSRHFAAPQRDWPANTVATGFCFHDETGYEEQTQTSWRSWLQSHPDPVVFTLGSSAVYDPGEFWNRSRHYLSQAARPGVFLTGQREPCDSPGTAFGPTILDLDYAPFSELFPTASLVVHQGGIGTLAQVLRAGVPHLVMPYAHDQPDNAQRVQDLGLGLKVTRHDYATGTATKLFQQLITGPHAERIRATDRRMAEQLRQEDGPGAALAVMERVGRR